MAAVDLKSLIMRLDELCRATLEGAAGFALMRTHYNLEIEHWLSKLMSESDSDFAAVLVHYGVDQGRSPSTSPAPSTS